MALKGIRVNGTVHKMDYNYLENIPEVDGTPTESSENLVTSGGVKAALDGKQASLTFDTTPTAGSTNPVTSGGLKTALDGKQASLTFDTSPTEGSVNPVTSDGIYNALQDVQGSLTFDDVPTEGSDNPVKSGGIYDALEEKQDELTFDTVPTFGSSHPITSGGVQGGLSKIAYSNAESGLDATDPQSAIDELAGQIQSLKFSSDAPNIYGARWDGTTHQWTRCFDAAGITTDVTNFVYKGTVNANYSNPFDSIYPWSECKQCNVDMAAYTALSSGDDIRDAVVAWYGDPDFATDGSNGFFGRYTPEFWYTGYTDESTGDRILLVSDKEIEGWEHHRPSIRSAAFAVDDGNNGVTATDGQPLTNIRVDAIHSRAKAAGMTMEDIYERDAETVLAIIEFASYDIQRVVGDGCSAGYYKCTVAVPAAATGATTVLLPKAAKAFCVEGATLDFGASQDAVVIANRREVVSVEDYDSTYCRVTFTPSLDLTTSMYASIHGKNCADSIGNKSGFVGTAGKVNAWYRGSIMWGNRNQYVLGIARQQNTGHVWLCPEDQCDDYDGLNTGVFVDTGIQVLTADPNAWKTVGSMNFMDSKGVHGFGIIKTSASVTGDSQYCCTLATGNTTPFFGGTAAYGAYCGLLFANWLTSPSNSSWTCSGVLLLKSP